MGLDVTFQEGEGPSLSPPVRTRADVERLRDFDPGVSTAFLGDSIRRVRAELGSAKAIIGFCGAPWTTASYMIEGGSSRNFEHSKSMLHGDPALFQLLCSRLVDNLIPYLAMQVEAGADVVQIFDSWGGALDADTYRAHLLPHVKRLVAGAKALHVPVILYVNGAAQLLEVLADSEADVLGIDWRVSPRDAIERVGSWCALQGNLDPCVLFAQPDVVASETRRVLDAFAGQKGYVFNLGSGILPKTPVESMEDALPRPAREALTVRRDAGTRPVLARSRVARARAVAKASRTAAPRARALERRRARACARRRTRGARGDARPRSISSSDRSAARSSADSTRRG
jgi:uroporphyrinogen decarboxylase